MQTLKKGILPIFLATIWIALSEFTRNEILAKSYWTDHYASLGLVFPSKGLNGAVWGLWSLLFAIAIYIIQKRFSLWQTTLLAWFVGFVLMWVVTWNMGVFPLSILPIAIPLSLLEVFFGALIIHKLAKS